MLSLATGAFRNMKLEMRAKLSVEKRRGRSLTPRRFRKPPSNVNLLTSPRGSEAKARGG